MPKLIGRWNRTRGVWETDAMDLLSEHSEPFSATWPTSGMTRSGAAFELPTPALPTAGSASSSLPTPRASRGASGTETMYALGAERSDTNRTQGEVLLPTPMTSEARGIGVHGQGAQDLRTTIALLKTPLSNLGQNGGSQHPDKRRAGGHGPTLADEVEHLLPTATASSRPKSTRALTSSTSNGRRSGGGQSSPLGLEEVASLLDGVRPDHLPPDEELPPASRRAVEALLPTPTTMAGGQATRSGTRSNELLLPGIARAVASGDRSALLWSAGSESPDE